MENKKILKTYSLDEIKDEMIGPLGSIVRDTYEFDLKMELIGEMIKKTRKERKLTQSELGELVGVQKAQISKLEKSATNATIGTITKVFHALKAEVCLKVTLMEEELGVDS